MAQQIPLMRNLLLLLLVSSLGATALASSATALGSSATALGSSATAAPGLAPALSSPTGEAAIARSLNIRWELLNNFYQGRRQTHTLLVLTNTGKETLPATGWALYFNSSAAPQSGITAVGLMMQDLSGSLFRIIPASGFKGLAPGDSLRLEYISSDAAANKSDAPEGFYMVWDDAPDKGISIGRYTKTPITNPSLFDRFPGDKVPEATPENIFSINQKMGADGDVPDAALVFPSPKSLITFPDSTGYYKGGPIQLEADLFKKEAQYLQTRLKEMTGVLPAIEVAPPPVIAPPPGPGGLSNAPGATSTPGSTGATMATSAPAPSWVALDPLYQAFSRGPEGIILVQALDTLADEGYRLRINGGRIRIEASTQTGMFYGIQTLLELFPTGLSHKSSYVLPALLINDEPRFGYRSLMIDVARNFQSQKEILRVLDLMAYCKLNVLRLHLTDDEGWRLDIPSLPELTAVGSKRGHTLDDHDFLRPCYGSGPDTNSVTGSGFYTKSQFEEILRHAQDLHIKVIPEIESPGHARAAIKAMDHRYRYYMQQGNQEKALEFLLRDTTDASVYSTPQLYHDNVMNIALPSVYRFINEVVTNIQAMYKEAGVPLETIHLGGDEVPAGVWEKSPACLAFVKTHPEMQEVRDLWYYYFANVDSLLKSKGLYTSAWEEAGMRKTILDGRPYILPNPDFARSGMQVHIWNNGDGAEDLAYRMANAGYKVVLSVASNLYFDMSYNKSFDEFGYYWATFLDADKPFSYIPFDYLRLLKVDEQNNPLAPGLKASKERLTEYGKANISGLEGCLWGETIRSADDLEYKMLPRTLGLAERAWAPDPAWATMKDTLAGAVAYVDAWGTFASTVGHLILPQVDALNKGYAYRIPTVGAITRDGKVWANVQFPGLVIRYTTDGREPDAGSTLYTGPISNKGRIRLRVFNAEGRGGRTVEVYNSGTALPPSSVSTSKLQ
jgi:hexosaminidase